MNAKELKEKAEQMRQQAHEDDTWEAGAYHAALSISLELARLNENLESVILDKRIRVYPEGGWE